MRKVIFMLLLLLCGHQLIAQSWNEWFKQKQTKLKYIAQQIAAFEAYANYLKKGYKIVAKGWNTINDIKHGDFDLHNNYFTSLQHVNSSVADYDKIDGITGVQLQILKLNDVTKKIIDDNANIQSVEKNYINKVMANLLGKCADDLDELKELTTNDSFVMKDDERLKRINELYNDIQDKYAFAKYFQSSVQTFALSRAKGANDINTFKILYGIK